MRRMHRWLLILGLACAFHVHAVSRVDALLRDADRLRSVDGREFSNRLDEVATLLKEAEPRQVQHWRYLDAYRSLVYRDDLRGGIERLKRLMEDKPSADLRYRAGALLINAYGLDRRFTDGFRQLHEILPLRNRVSDKAIKHDGLYAVAFFYNEMGQYRLGLKYARELLADNPLPRGECVGAIALLDAEYHLAKLPESDAPIIRRIDQCLAINERMAAMFIRVLLAKKWVKEGRLDEAKGFIEQHIPEAEAIGYWRLLADMRAMAAELALDAGSFNAAKKHAQKVLEHAAEVPSSSALVKAWRVFYEVALHEKDMKAALNAFRRYADADKAHLADLRARELAYEMVRLEAQGRARQIEALEQQNQLLQLQQRLEREQAQKTRLAVVLLVFLLAAVTYWAIQVKRRQGLLRRMAETDALTGVFNRHHFTRQAEQALAKCAQAGEPAALIMFDLDHFKSINDGYGHITGDWVLRAVADTCQELCRRMDHFGRLGGEEFAILLHGLDLSAAARLAEDCRVRIARIDTRETGHVFAITASFGVSSTVQSGHDLSRLLSHADLMLYRAKHDGRNCVRVYGNEPPPDPAARRAQAPLSVVH